MRFMQEVEISHLPPTPEEFVTLRAAVNWPERTIPSATKGIPNTLFWITLRKKHLLIGMGRVVGDSGSVVLVSDVIVHPKYQAKGYASLIFDYIQEFILANIPDDAFVCFFAEKDIAPLCEQKGFQFSHDQWSGMFWPCAERKKIHRQKPEDS